jgi:hypothetical protein
MSAAFDGVELRGRLSGYTRRSTPGAEAGARLPEKC